MSDPTPDPLVIVHVATWTEEEPPMSPAEMYPACHALFGEWLESKGVRLPLKPGQHLIQVAVNEFSEREEKEALEAIRGTEWNIPGFQG